VRFFAEPDTGKQKKNLGSILVMSDFKIELFIKYLFKKL
jgi:hypothetical protein|tara:strand:+ start:132452 stop:132568 length:117 start_codon:yes stop_codon:yes gene_type:complete